MGRRTNQLRLAVEALEDRSLLSGNVIATFSTGKLTVRGDAVDNQIQLVQQPNGALRVQGLTGTTVNGQAFFDTGKGAKDVAIKMKQGGADQVMIEGPFALQGNLDVYLGDGTALIEGSAGPVTIGKNLSIRSGAQSDVTLRNEVHVIGNTMIDSGGTASAVAGRATLPNFASAVFSHSLNINNPYYPLVAGTKYTYEGKEGNVVTENSVFDVLPQTRTIVGVDTRVVRDRVFRDGKLSEDTFDWFAQDNTGNVWYLGENVTNYNYDKQGNLIGTTPGGSWEAGVNGAVPGVIMEANPQVGDRYYQEFNPNDVMDQAVVRAKGLPVAVPAGAFGNVLRTKDTSALAPSRLTDKFYAPGLGSVQETSFDYLTGEVTEVVSLISAELNGKVVTQLVPPTGFAGTNVSGKFVGGVRLDRAATLDADNAVTVLETVFGSKVAIASGTSDVSVANTVFVGQATFEAGGTVGLRNLDARQNLNIESDHSVYILDSKFRANTKITLGDGDDTLAISGSVFSCLDADGGFGLNTFTSSGNFFGKLKLQNF